MAIKKWLVGIGVSVMCMALLAGCSGEEKKVAENAPASTETKVEDKATSENPYYVSDEMTEASIFLFFNGITFKEDYPVFEKAAEMTNFKMKSFLSENTTNGKQAFNLMVASGDMADIVAFESLDIDEVGMQGGFIDLEALIKEHGPNISKFYSENPELKKLAYAPDGKMYRVPYYVDGTAAQGFYLRTDWLKKLGLEMPQTTAEYHDVLKAFKEQDPNGNGLNDEIPYFDREKNPMVDLLSLWDCNLKYFEADGKIGYGPMTDEYKIAMTNIKEWYNEGLIDPEIFTRGKKARDILLTDNIGGSTHDWFGSTASYNDKLKDSVEGFEFLPMAPPENQNGRRFEATSRSKTLGGWGITVSAENPVEIIKYFDFWFSEEGRRLINFGVEDQHYTLVDGKPVYTDYVMKSEKNPLQMLRGDGAQLRIGFHQDFDYERAWLNPIAKAGMELYMENNYPNEQYGLIEYPSLKFTEEEKAELERLEVNISTYVEEKMQEWILSSVVIEDEHADFVKRLEELGMEDVLKIYQAAYDRK